MKEDKDQDRRAGKKEGRRRRRSGQSKVREEMKEKETGTKSEEQRCIEEQRWRECVIRRRGRNR